jgi:hypothetical protein
MDYTVAKTIQAQIGHRAFVMLGTKQIILCPDSLRFNIGGGAKSKINWIDVIYHPGHDLYHIKFWRLSKNASIAPVLVSEWEDCYFDQLHDIIESETGFYTKL